MLLLRLPPDGTPVETAIDASRQQAQASEGHAHVRMYGHGWQRLECTHWTGMLAALIDSDITPLDYAVCSRLHATHAARREPWMRGWTCYCCVYCIMPGPSISMLPAWDQGDTRANAKNSSHPSHHPTQSSDNDLRSHHTSALAET